MNKARIGVIGAGWWGTVGHLEPLSKDERAQIVAVYSRTEAKAKERAARYNVDRYYDDYRRMIDECALDGVIIATTPNVHYEQARYALEHGVNVLMEKPFVLHTAEAEELARMAKDRGLHLSVCYPTCFYPWCIEGRKHIRAGALGKLLIAHHMYSQRVYDLFRGDVAGMFGSTSDPSYPYPNAMSYADPAIVGGGTGHTGITHALGELLFMTEMQPESVFAYMNNLDVAVDVVDVISVRFTGGCLATLTATSLVPRNVAALPFQIIGDKGMIDCDARQRHIEITLEGEGEPRSLDRTKIDIFAAVPRNFVRALLGEEQLLVSTEVAVNAVKVLDAAYRSAETGQAVNIS